MPTPPKSNARNSAASSRRPREGAPQQAVDPASLLSPQVRQILDNFRLEDVVTHLLRRAHFRAEEIFAQEFAAESITPRQKAALVILYQQPGLSQNALADRLFMDRNTVAEMVKRLASGGLIARVPAKDDQRAYQLFLAPGGARLLEQVMPRDAQVEQRVLDMLPQEYRALFFKCLRLLVEPVSPQNGPG